MWRARLYLLLPAADIRAAVIPGVKSIFDFALVRLSDYLSTPVVFRHKY